MRPKVSAWDNQSVRPKVSAWDNQSVGFNLEGTVSAASVLRQGKG